MTSVETARFPKSAADLSHTEGVPMPVSKSYAQLPKSDVSLEVKKGDLNPRRLPSHERLQGGRKFDFGISCACVVALGGVASLTAGAMLWSRCPETSSCTEEKIATFSGAGALFVELFLVCMLYAYVECVIKNKKTNETLP